MLSRRRPFRETVWMLGQSDVIEARVIDQALVVSSPRDGVTGSDVGTRWGVDGGIGSEEDALPVSF